MARQKKKSRSTRYMPLPLRRELTRIHRLVEAKQWEEAQKRQNALIERYPNHPAVWETHGLVFSQFPQQIAYSAEKLQELDPNNPLALYYRAVAAELFGLSILAHSTFQEAQKRTPPLNSDVESMDLWKTMVKHREETLQEFSRRFPQLSEEAERILLEHETAVYYTELGMFDKALAILDRLLRKYPDFAPAYQSKGFIYLIQLQVEKALEFYYQALERQPDNLLLLSEIALLTYVLERDEETAQHLKALLPIQPRDESEAYQKVLTLAALSDEKTIIQAVEEARPFLDEMEEPRKILVNHIEATARYVLGEEDEAQQLWLDSLLRSASHPFAPTVFEDWEYPRWARHIPWYISPGDLPFPFPPILLKESNELPEDLDTYFREHPYVFRLTKLYMERGNPFMRLDMFYWMLILDRPEIYPTLLEVAQGQSGPDFFRKSIYHYLYTKGAVGDTVTMWYRGKYQEVSLKHHPTIPGIRGFAELPWDAESLTYYGLQALGLEEPTRARALLKRAASLEPQQMFIRYYMAHALRSLKQNDQLDALIRQMEEIAPDHPLLRLLLLQNQIFAGERQESIREELEALQEEGDWLFEETLAMRETQIIFHMAWKDEETAIDILRDFTIHLTHPVFYEMWPLSGAYIEINGMWEEAVLHAYHQKRPWSSFKRQVWQPDRKDRKADYEALKREHLWFGQHVRIRPDHLPLFVPSGATGWIVDATFLSEAGPLQIAVSWDKPTMDFFDKLEQQGANLEELGVKTPLAFFPPSAIELPE
ncbi:MAG: hypothetical protein GXO55_10480 [Chloroflexi bacterium]|nr:hypothetical protein [Chloroflexota bacterium]